MRWPMSSPSTNSVLMSTKMALRVLSLAASRVSAFKLLAAAFVGGLLAAAPPRLLDGERSSARSSRSQWLGGGLQLAIVHYRADVGRQLLDLLDLRRERCFRGHRGNVPHLLDLGRAPRPRPILGRRPRIGRRQRTQRPRQPTTTDTTTDTTTAAAATAATTRRSAERRRHSRPGPAQVRRGGSRCRPTDTPGDDDPRGRAICVAHQPNRGIVPPVLPPPRGGVSLPAPIDDEDRRVNSPCPISLAAGMTAWPRLCQGRGDQRRSH